MNIIGVDYSSGRDYGVTLGVINSDGSLTVTNILRDFEPCAHPGCLSHFSHPCEGCGRIGGRPPSTTAAQQPHAVDASPVTDNLDAGESSGSRH